MSVEETLLAIALAVQSWIAHDIRRLKRRVQDLSRAVDALKKRL